MLRKITVALLAVTILALATIGGISFWAWYKDAEFQALERDLRTNLPIGTADEEIASYLDRKRIRNYYDEKHNEIVGWIANFNNALVVRTDVRIIAELDAERKLRRLRIEQLHTGL